MRGPLGIGDSELFAPDAGGGVSVRWADLAGVAPFDFFFGGTLAGEEVGSEAIGAALFLSIGGLSIKVFLFPLGPFPDLFDAVGDGVLAVTGG